MQVSQHTQMNGVEEWDIQDDVVLDALTPDFQHIPYFHATMHRHRDLCCTKLVANPMHKNILYNACHMGQ